MDKSGEYFVRMPWKTRFWVVECKPVLRAWTHCSDTRNWWCPWSTLRRQRRSRTPLRPRSCWTSPDNLPTNGKNLTAGRSHLPAACPIRPCRQCSPPALADSRPHQIQKKSGSNPTAGDVRHCFFHKKRQLLTNQSVFFTGFQHGVYKNSVAIATTTEQQKIFVMIMPRPPASTPSVDTPFLVSPSEYRQPPWALNFAPSRASDGPPLTSTRHAACAPSSARWQQGIPQREPGQSRLSKPPPDHTR